MDTDHRIETLDGSLRITGEYDWDERAPSTGIVETLAVAMDCDPTDVPPLFPVVDPDAIDTFFDGLAGDSTRRLALSLEDWTVTVEADGVVVEETVIEQPTE